MVKLLGVTCGITPTTTIVTNCGGRLRSLRGRNCGIGYNCFYDDGARRSLWCRAEEKGGETTQTPSEEVTDVGSSTSTSSGPVTVELDKEVSKFARNAATTFAPRASGATKNPAYKGSLLYKVFEIQAWVALVIGGALSFNLLFPSDEPDIARLIGMWSIWMFTVPSLRARECTSAEKDALNVLFLAIPLLNVLLPFVWKSFPFIFTADCVLMAGVYAWKGLLPGQSNENDSNSS